MTIIIETYYKISINKLINHFVKIQLEISIEKRIDQLQQEQNYQMLRKNHQTVRQ